MLLNVVAAPPLMIRYHCWLGLVESSVVEFPTPGLMFIVPDTVVNVPFWKFRKTGVVFWKLPPLLMFRPALKVVFALAVNWPPELTATPVKVVGERSWKLPATVDEARNAALGAVAVTTSVEPAPTFVVPATLRAWFTMSTVPAPVVARLPAIAFAPTSRLRVAPPVSVNVWAAPSVNPPPLRLTAPDAFTFEAPALNEPE